MIEQNAAKPVRKVAVASHLWDAFEQMAKEMGTERDALINQAMHMFARLNGFVVPGSGFSRPPSAPPRAAKESYDRNESVEGDSAREEDLGPPPAAPMLRRDEGEKEEEADQDEPKPRFFGSGTDANKSSSSNDEDPRRREVAERVLETAAELERLIKGKSQAAPASDGGRSISTDDVAGSPAKQLFIQAEDGEMDRVAKDRFLIGRGKHCDFIVNSGKVSREHAVIVRDGSEYFIEDLGSSNGTWFNKQRIKRRKIEDGDEYYICSEKIRCVMR